MISIPVGARVLVATRPIDFRKGAHSLAALAAEVLGEDPFSGVVIVFRAKRAQQAKFCIQFAVCEDRLPLAPAVWSYAPGVALPAR